MGHSLAKTGRNICFIHQDIRAGFYTSFQSNQKLDSPLFYDYNCKGVKVIK
jgi:hypothetical protein